MIASIEHKGVYMATIRSMACCTGLALALTAMAGSLSAGESEVPRTSWGKPDLQGVWDFRTITPLQRPKALGDKAVLTDQEVAELEERAERRQQVDRPPAEGSVGLYNAFWLDSGTNVVENNRTSLIVDPPDGRLPELAANAKEQIASHSADQPGRRPVRYRSGGIGADGPEDRGLGTRCLMGFNNGPPMVPSGYSNIMQLFQSPDHVVILNEVVHDARIVPLNGRPQLPEGVRQWSGNSRGRWEGDTLVVETTNFTDKTASFDPSPLTGLGTGETLHLIERFSRLDADTLLYEFTVDDPVTFTRPFSAALPMRMSADPVFEFACHEGNYAMFNILAGARAEETDAP